ncbi:MAG: aconitate hydratase, partial [Candidatus Bathyarchaeota archaeon]|nr:aconitate hydratase [Candidatus Bathyarchaeota archaeon]
IHSANLINFGIVPLTFQTEEDYDKIDQGDQIQIENIRESISQNQPLTVKNVTKNSQIKVKYQLSQRQRDIILAGGMLAYIKNK